MDKILFVENIWSITVNIVNPVVLRSCGFTGESQILSSRKYGDANDYSGKGELSGKKIKFWLVIHWSNKVAVHGLRTSEK